MYRYLLLKVNYGILIFLISYLFCSCGQEEDIHYYHKNFFLGETAFLIEGEATNTASSLITIISSGSAHYSLDRYNNYKKGWEVSSTEVSEKNFEILVDVTANGVTLSSEILAEGVITPMGFPDKFPSCYLVFHPKNDLNSYREIYTYSIINEIKYYCTFIYVAEPIDLSGTRVVEINQVKGDGRVVKKIRDDIHHYDYNFTKLGWYKIVDWHHEPIGNDPLHSSVSNIYFYEPDYRY